MSFHPVASLTLVILPGVLSPAPGSLCESVQSVSSVGPVGDRRRGGSSLSGMWPTQDPADSLSGDSLRTRGSQPTLQ